MLNLFKRRELKTIDKSSIDKEIESFSGCGICENDSDIIVSLTSFPERMYDIHYTLFSLLNQSFKPKQIILWLAREEFPNLEKDVPEKVLKLQSNGLTIKWCNNIRSYKKLIPSIKEFSNYTIVTADDDVYYDSTWLERLVNAHRKYPNYIVCHRAHRIKFNKNHILPYKKWNKKIKCDDASYLNFFTGIGGVLYPPSTLYKDVINEELFTKLAPKTDDIWFWAMAVLNNTKVFVVKDRLVDLSYVNPERERGLTNEKTLFSENKKGGNDIALAKILDYYPQIFDKIKK